jgi:thiol-disulfide isomerase/thioredoxin
MNRLLPVFALLCAVFGAKAQAYDIRVNFKGAKDTMVYLVKYQFDQQYIVDTAKNVKNGNIRFSGKKDLDKGVYTLVSQEKSIYFDLFVNDSQKYTVTTDMADAVGNLKVTGSKDNELFFSYIKFITSRNREFQKTREQTKGMNKSDSTAFMAKKIAELNAEVSKFEKEFMEKSKGTYVNDVLNLKTEKSAPSVPKASNGRPDSVYSYYYYRNHYFDGIDFKDERIIRTPFFDDRLKKYFDQVILQHPDTVIQEIDKLMARSAEGNLVYNLMLGYFTYKYEQSKIMGFDKVFVHVADKYIISGHAKGVYTDETVTKIKERVDIMRNLLLESKVQELYMIDTTNGKAVRKMGFDTASSSKALTDLYYKNIEKLTPMFRTLYQVNAKYTVLVFWAVDCGHCQTEIPKLHEDLKALKGIDYKVFAVQTKDDLFETWRKFLIEKKLHDFIHVFDPIHLNNLKERFDIYSTPVIYVLDKDKKIKAKRLGAEQVVEMLKTLDAIDKEQEKSKVK